MFVRFFVGVAHDGGVVDREWQPSAPATHAPDSINRTGRDWRGVARQTPREAASDWRWTMGRQSVRDEIETLAEVRRSARTADVGTIHAMRSRYLTSTMLWSGVLVPVLYFGAQLVRGPFVEGYSFRHNAASDLGAVGVPGASWFNAMAVASGLAAIAASFGWWHALDDWAVGGIRRSLLCLALISIGLASIAAGAFPLPDERHGGGALGAGLFALPLLLVLATVRSQVAPWLRRYAVANLLLFVLAALLFSGATGVDPTVNEGVLQRVLALSVFPPIGVVSAAALRGRR